MTNTAKRVQLILAIFIPLPLILGCPWPYPNPNNGITYPTNQVSSIAWSLDGSKLFAVVSKQQTEGAESETWIESYDRDGKLVSAVKANGDLYSNDYISPDPQGKFIYCSNGTDVTRADISTGELTPFVYSYTIVTHSESGKYLVLRESSYQGSLSAIVDVGTSQLRIVRRWQPIAYQQYPSYAWSGDSNIAYLIRNNTGAAVLIVTDTAFASKDTLQTTNDLNAIDEQVRCGGGSFYLVGNTGIMQLDHQSGGTWVVRDTAGRSEISRDGKMAAYVTNFFYSGYYPSSYYYDQGSTLKLANLSTGKTITIEPSAFSSTISPTSDRLGYVQGSDYNHQSVKVVPVSPP